jgi:hypothetical protein
MVMFFGLLLAMLILSVVLIVKDLRDKTPRRPLTPQEELYLDLQRMQDRQNAIEEDRRMTDRMRNY